MIARLGVGGARRLRECDGCGVGNPGTKRRKRYFGIIYIFFRGTTSQYITTKLNYIN